MNVIKKIIFYMGLNTIALGLSLSMGTAFADKAFSGDPFTPDAKYFNQHIAPHDQPPTVSNTAKEPSNTANKPSPTSNRPAQSRGHR